VEINFDTGVVVTDKDKECRKITVKLIVRWYQETSWFKNCFKKYVTVDVCGRKAIIFALITVYIVLPLSWCSDVGLILSVYALHDSSLGQQSTV